MKINPQSAIRNPQSSILFALFVSSWLIFGRGAPPANAIAAQEKRASYGPAVKAYLTGLGEELNELEYQLRREEITRTDYERAKQRLTILRQFVERYVAENREDIVPEYQALAEDELATLGLVREYKADELIAGAELDDQWKVVWVQTGGIQSGADRKPVRFLILERLQQGQMNFVRESKLGRSIDPRDVIETIIIPAETLPIPPPRSPNADQAEIDMMAEAPKPSLHGPRLLSVSLPRYSAKARNKKIEGEVIVRALFRRDGKIKEAKIERGLGFGLDERAIEAVKRSVFRPAQLDGKDVDVRAQIIVGFNLENVYIYIGPAELDDAGEEDKR
ncbi:MAG: energy transducer TonB [Blastocatellia bacterium]